MEGRYEAILLASLEAFSESYISEQMPSHPYYWVLSFAYSGIPLAG